MPPRRGGSLLPLPTIAGVEALPLFVAGVVPGLALVGNGILAAGLVFEIAGAVLPAGTFFVIDLIAIFNILRFDWNQSLSLYVFHS
jgi:hypothetical protein